MIRVINQASVLVQKNSLCFLERDAMLYQVRSSLAAIPGKFNIARIIILAISSGKWGLGCIDAYCTGRFRRSAAAHFGLTSRVPHSQPVNQASARAFAGAGLRASALPSSFAVIVRLTEAGINAFMMRFSQLALKS